MFGPVGLAFKALTLKAKLLAIGGVLAVLVITHGAVGYVWYNKGVNVAAVQIQAYETRVQALQAQVNQRQGQVNQAVTVKYLDRVHNIETVRYVNRDVIRSNVVSRPTTLSRGWVYSHNQAAAGLPIDPSQAANPAESGVSDANALVPIANNYAEAQRLRAQVDGWQTWYRDTRANYEQTRTQNNQRRSRWRIGGSRPAEGNPQ